MKKIFLSMAAVGAIAAAAPASAQYANGNYQTQNNGYQNNGYQNGANGNIAVRIQQLQTRIQAGVQSGVITRSEAQPLRQQLRALTQLERRYSLNGISGQERADLQLRLRNLRQQVRAADGGAQGYGQYDRDDDYSNGQYGQNGQSGRYDRAYDRNNDGFDDRDLDRDGRWDDDVRNGSVNGGYDRQYEDRGYEQPAQRSGIGGLFDRVLGTGGLRVGQRASGNLSALPSEYRNQYRDSSSAYFRTDGRQIYQIDARSDTVVRIYAMNR